MSKMVQAFLTGLFFTFILDFFLFLGIYQNYIKVHEIDVYYNILFADHQNIFIFGFFTLFIGYIVIYTGKKISIFIMSILFLGAFSTLIPSVGSFVAEKMLMQKGITLYTKKFSYHGDLYYNGRKTITFYDYELKKVIILDKNKIQSGV
jgi:hypothetical protein